MKSDDAGWEDEQVKAALEVLQVVPERSIGNTARGQADYLSEARRAHQAVSARQAKRLNGWSIPFLRKEPFRMTTVASLILALTLALGGTSATALASQGSQPEDLLYPVKVSIENVRLAATRQTNTRIELALQYADLRIEELAAIFEAGERPAEKVAARWQQQINLAMQLASGQPDDEIGGYLLQISQHLQDQDRILERTQAAGGSEPTLLGLRQMAQDRLRQVESGLTDPTQFRQRIQSGLQAGEPNQGTVPQENGGGNPWTTGTPTPLSGYGPGGGDPGGADNPWTTDVPGAGNGNGPGGGDSGNPWTDSTPTPGSGYGPGTTNEDSGNPWTDETPTPGSGYGTGPGDGEGGNPWTDSTPTPGSGYGPGPGPGECTTCTPSSGQGNRPG